MKRNLLAELLVSRLRLEEKHLVKLPVPALCRDQKPLVELPVLDTSVIRDFPHCFR